MFEGQELFPVAQVPLAHQLGPVPGGGQHLGEEELRVGDPTHHLLRGVRVPPRVGGLVEPVPQGQPGTSGLINLETEEAGTSETSSTKSLSRGGDLPVSRDALDGEQMAALV